MEWVSADDQAGVHVVGLTLAAVDQELVSACDHEEDQAEPPLSGNE